MADSVEALLILVLTMPGFLGYLLFNRLHDGSVDDSFEKVGIVVGFNALSLGLLSWWGFQNPTALLTHDNQVDATKAVQFMSASLFWSTAICMCLALVAALIVNNHWVNRTAIGIGLTRKSSGKSVLADVIRSYPDAYLKFRLKSGGYIVGHPRCFSLDAEENVMFLQNAAVKRSTQIGASGASERPVNGQGVVLLTFDEVLFVEVI